MDSEEYQTELDDMLDETELPLEFQKAIEEIVMEFSTQQSDYREMLEQCEAIVPILERAVKAYVLNPIPTAARSVLQPNP